MSCFCFCCCCYYCFLFSHQTIKRLLIYFDQPTHMIVFACDNYVAQAVTEINSSRGVFEGGHVLGDAFDQSNQERNFEGGEVLGDAFDHSNQERGFAEDEFVPVAQRAIDESVENHITLERKDDVTFDDTEL